MARHESDFRSGAEELLGLEELLALLAKPGEGDSRSREDAIACYLSGSDGWREAMKQLDGAFAGRATKLKDRKDD